MASETNNDSIELFRFRRQWLVGTDATTLNPAWKSMHLSSGHTLSYHPEVRVSTRCHGGNQIVMLGIATHTTSQTPPLLIIETLDRESIIQWLLRLVGRYVILFSEGENLYLYTDPAGMMGIFHTSGQAASAPSLFIQMENQAITDTGIRRELEESFFPGTMCAYCGVDALLANHELHLNTGISRRFWSPATCLIRDKPPIEEMCGLIQRIMKGFRSSGQLLVSLTGGKDSRVILAAVRTFVTEVRFFTIQSFHSAETDVRYSRQLAAMFQLNHEILQSQTPPQWVTSAFDEIGSGMRRAQSRSELDGLTQLDTSGCVHVGGVGGEIFRAHLWPSQQPRTAGAKELTRQVFSCSPPSIIDAVGQWRKSLPLDMAASTVFDLFEFEQRTGRSASIVESCSCLFYETVSPFNSRELFELTLCIPMEMRYAGTLNVALIQTMWPQLLDVPVTQGSRSWWKSLPKPLKFFVKRLMWWAGYRRYTSVWNRWRSGRFSFPAFAPVNKIKTPPPNSFSDGVLKRPG